MLCYNIVFLDNDTRNLILSFIQVSIHSRLLHLKRLFPQTDKKFLRNIVIMGCKVSDIEALRIINNRYTRMKLFNFIQMNIDFTDSFIQSNDHSNINFHNLLKQHYDPSKYTNTNLSFKNIMSSFVYVKLAKIKQKLHIGHNNNKYSPYISFMLQTSF